MLKSTEHILREASENFAKSIAQIQEPFKKFERTIASFTEPIRKFEEQIKQQQDAFAQMNKFLAAVDLPKIVASDILDAWAVQGVDIDEYVENSAELAEDLSYDFAESLEEVIEKHSKETGTTQIRLTSNGRMFHIDSPDKDHELSEQMEKFFRALKKGFTATDKLVTVSGYATERSLRTAANKLNRLGRGKLGLSVPIAVGKRGKGYRLGRRIHVHRLPNKLDR